MSAERQARAENENRREHGGGSENAQKTEHDRPHRGCRSAVIGGSRRAALLACGSPRDGWLRPDRISRPEALQAAGPGLRCFSLAGGRCGTQAKEHGDERKEAPRRD
jgi:hypothetical protein